MLDVQHSKFGFSKSSIVAVLWLSLSRTLNRGQLSLDRWTCACTMCLSKMHFKQVCLKSHC
ncbi:DUF645 family protein [Vibrio vulnificus]|nr:DUF645 family protein [Vibrio vulnificus]ELV8614266.1 DUF645 family protein [Vibrio vulnificus]MCU8137805.1 DUF645 family protein [Vibrio vulnificus]